MEALYSAFIRRYQQEQKKNKTGSSYQWKLLPNSKTPVNNNRKITSNVSEKTVKDTLWTNEPPPNASTVSCTKKSINIKQTPPTLSPRFMTLQIQHVSKPKLLQKFTKKFNMSYNKQIHWTKLETYFKEQQNNQNAWQSLDSPKPRTKNVFQKITPLMPSISQPVSDIMYPRKRTSKQPMHSATNSWTASTKLDGNKKSSPNHLPTTSTTTEIEAMEIIHEDTVGTHMDTKVIGEDKTVFLSKAKLGIPTTLRLTTTRTAPTTIPAPATTSTTTTDNNVTNVITPSTNCSLYHPLRWYQTRWTPSILFSLLEDDYNTQVASFSGTTRLSDSISLTTTTLETETTTAEFTRTTSSK